jgi:hypothetical protein
MVVHSTVKLGQGNVWESTHHSLMMNIRSPFRSFAAGNSVRDKKILLYIPCMWAVGAPGQKRGLARKSIE